MDYFLILYRPNHRNVNLQVGAFFALWKGTANGSMSGLVRLWKIYT